MYNCPCNQFLRPVRYITKLYTLDWPPKFQCYIKVKALDDKK